MIRFYKSWTKRHLDYLIYDTEIQQSNSSCSLKSLVENGMMGNVHDKKNMEAFLSYHYQFLMEFEDKASFSEYVKNLHPEEFV